MDSVNIKQRISENKHYAGLEIISGISILFSLFNQLHYYTLITSIKEALFTALEVSPGAVIPIYEAFC